MPSKHNASGEQHVRSFQLSPPKPWMNLISSIKDVAASELSDGLAFEWTELTYLQLIEGSAAIFAFIGAVLLVYLVLAAQYESWSMPMAVLRVVPMCLLIALAGMWMWRMDINIFVQQVGFIVFVGLAAKNAILIVETARARRAEGMSALDAAVSASKNRLRPIIMTSFAIILGTAPLVISHGAGAEMRRTLGVHWNARHDALRYLPAARLLFGPRKTRWPKARRRTTICGDEHN